MGVYGNIKTFVTEMNEDQSGLINQLRSTLGKMEVALGAIADAIVWMDDDGKIQWCNAAFDRLVGQPHITVLGAKLKDLLPLTQYSQSVAALDYPNLKVLQGKYTAAEYEVQRQSDRLILEISGNSVELTDQERVAVLVIRDITEAKRLEAQRQQTEATLRQSEMKFRSIVENANDMIALIDATGTIIYISSNLQPIAGYAPSELEGEPFLPFIHPDDHPHCIEAFQRVAITGERQSGVEYRAKLKHGGWQWQSTNLAALEDANGNMLVISVARDLTERKQAEASLRRSNAILKAQQEASIDGILVVDEVRDVVSYNQRFCQLWNIPDSVIEQGTSRALLNWVIQQLEHPQEFLEKVEYLYTHPEATSRDEISVLDGRTLDRYSAAVRSQGGDYYGRIWYFRDISERVQAEIEQKRSEEAANRRAQLDNLLSSISRQFIDQEIDVAINFALHKLAQFLRTERSRLLVYSESQRLSYITHEWCADGVLPLAGARSVAVDEAPWLYNHVLYNAKPLVVSHLNELPPEAFAEKAGLESLLIQSIAIVPMMYMGKVVGFIGTDTVSDSKTWNQEEINLIQLVGEIIAIGQSRHAAEEALRLAKDAAEAANRAKSTFLANMSHELRTPLNAILGFAQLMERSHDLSLRQRDFLATINRSGEHLLSLINDVLEMSKIEAGRIVLNPIPCDLYHLLQAIEDMVQVRADAKALSFQVERAPDLPQYILIDEGKLRQVLINLLSNAVKFTDAGEVQLRVRTVPDGLYFEVQDTGRGIASEELDHLFQPFVQTTSGKQIQEGTGLGLTISRQFVQLMGGDIQVNSTVGLGSTFSFEIPIVLTEPFESALSVPSRRVLRLAPDQPLYRLLIVDDRPENNELLTQLLQSVGFEVCSAVNGEDAIAQWQTWQPHLIWMDMRMPVMDGYEATRQIRLQESLVIRHSSSDGERHEARGTRKDEKDTISQEIDSQTTSHEPRTNELTHDRGQRTKNKERNTVIIALTASAFEEQRSRILAVGCDDMVRKPFREQVIFDKLSEHLGVQYLYAESQLEAGKIEASNVEIDVALFQGMPVEWISALQQAAIEVDAELIFELIEQLPRDQIRLANGLRDLCDRFCYDEILELTQTLL